MNEYEVFELEGYIFERVENKVKMFDKDNILVDEFSIKNYKEKDMVKACGKKIDEFESIS